MTRFADTTELGRLRMAADVAITDVINVKPGERVLIVTNPEENVQRISKALFDATVRAEGVPTLIFQEKRTQLDMANTEVLGALRTHPDVLISISAEKLGKDPDALGEPIEGEEKSYDHVFNFLLGEKKARSFWSPSVTEEMFAKTVPIDYGKMRSQCEVLSSKLTQAMEAHITSELGTDIVVGLHNRKAKSDDGDFRDPGKGGNLPAGEVFISPALGMSDGIIWFDGSISSHDGVIIIEDPIKVDVKDGFVVRISGKGEAKEAVKLNESLVKGKETAMKFGEEGKLKAAEAESYAKNAYNLGELGIGLNPAAEIVGNMLEDEKVLSTCHIAIGSNYDEDAKALIHLDGLIKEPTIVLKYNDGTTETIMDAGKLITD